MQRRNQSYDDMTTLQMKLNAELFGALQTISSDEDLLKKAVRSLKRIAAKSKSAPKEMTREEFYAKLDKGEEEYRQGKYYEMLPGESLEAFLNRVD